MKSPLAPQFAALESIAWSLFIAASVLMAVVVPFGIGEAQVRASIADPALQTAIIRLLGALDGTWITLAAINTYVFLTQAEGIATARRWAAMILCGSSVAAWIGARTGYPFGPFVFTENLGARLGHVLPFTVPLLWLAVILNSRYAMLRLFPQSGHWLLAFGTAALALVTDLNLEPVAWKMRAWWLWYPAVESAPARPPLTNYVSWFALTLTMAGFLRATHLAVLKRGTARRPLVLWAILNGVLLAANLAALRA